MESFYLIFVSVYDAMECLRWSSLVPQGQCLLAPLILVILDTSKFYDYLVKMIFKLHGQLPPDALEGHRSRFRVGSDSLFVFVPVFVIVVRPFRKCSDERRNSMRNQVIFSTLNIWFQFLHCRRYVHFAVLFAYAELSVI